MKPPAFDYIGRQLGHAPQPMGPPVSLERLDQQPLAAINVGLESFYTSLAGQGATAVHVDWRPPAGVFKVFINPKESRLRIE